MEIERKYLIPSLPERLEQYESKEIEQGYLCTDPVVRIRRSNDSYILTYKGEGLMVREEYNLPLTKEGYAHLREKVDGILITKTRYMIPFTGGLTIELDIFSGELSGLLLAEVEFQSGGRSEPLHSSGMVRGRRHLLHQISQQYPEPIRLILGGYSRILP